MKPMDIEVHIEELVLHGFAPGDRYHIADAVERELARSFAQQGLSPSLRNGIEIARVDGGVFRVAGGAKAETVGSQVAQAVYGGLTR